MTQAEPNLATERPLKRTESVVVGRVEELPPGSVTIVPRGKFGIGVYNVGGSFFALTNYCLHRGAPLCRGQVTGKVDGSDGGVGSGHCVLRRVEVVDDEGGALQRRRLGLALALEGVRREPECLGDRADGLTIPADGKRRGQ